MTDSVIKVEAEPTKLTQAQYQRATKIFRNTPVIALPNSGMGGYPTTVEGVIDYVEHLSKAVTHWIRKADDSHEEMIKLKADLAAAGRLFRMITEEPLTGGDQ